MSKARRVIIESVSAPIEAWLIDWSIKDGVLYAVVELDSGEIRSYDVPSEYNITNIRFKHSQGKGE